MTVMSVIDQNQNEGRKKQVLVEAAIEIFHQKGYQQARVSDIVARAGVAQGTFYLYFPSKEAIFRHICTEFMQRFSLAFQKSEHVFDGSTQREIWESMSRFIRELLIVYRENGEVAELISREGIGHGGLFKEIYEDLFIHFHQLLRARLKDSIQRGVVRLKDPETTSIFMIGLFERSMFLFSLMGKKLTVDELAEHMTAFIMKGLSLNMPVSLDSGI